MACSCNSKRKRGGVGRTKKRKMARYSMTASLPEIAAGAVGFVVANKVAGMIPVQNELAKNAILIAGGLVLAKQFGRGKTGQLIKGAAYGMSLKGATGIVQTIPALNGIGMLPAYGSTSVHSVAGPNVSGLIVE